MSIPEAIAVGSLIALAGAHSALGESSILRPLFAAEWTTTGTPRWAMQKILRFGWHLTSIAWVALGAIAAGMSPLPIIGAMSFVSAALIFFELRAHLAWPIFLVGGLAAIHAYEPLPEALLRIGALVAAAAFIAAAAIHVYWATGGHAGASAVFPTDPNRDEPLPAPGPALTFAVAVLLGAFAALVASAALDVGPKALRWLVGIGVGVLTLRAIGDTKYAGFTKTIRTTEFAKADDRLFTPLCVLLALGASASLLV